MANPLILGGKASVQSVYKVHTRQEHALGTVGFLDERKFIYASNTGSAIATNNLCTHGASVANHVSVAWASGGGSGTKTVTVTLGATAATANQYQDGYLIAIDGTAPGQFRKIKSHPAAGSGATLEVTVYDDFEVSLTDEEISLVANVNSGVIVTPGNTSPALVGVPQVAVPAGTTDTQYFWLQTWGPGSVIGDGSTFADGSPVVAASAGTADAGQVTLGSESSGSGTANDPSDLVPFVGHIIEASDGASDGDARLVDFRIR